MTVKTDNETQSADHAFLSQKDVAALFRVSMKTIYNWRVTGILKGSQIGGVIRFRREDVLALMDNPGQQ